MSFNQLKISTALIRTGLVCIGLSLLWWFRPETIDAAVPEAFSKKPPPRENPPQESKRMSTEVNLILDTPLSETATLEMMEGRFIMETTIPDEEEKGEVFRQLFLRGGVVIAMDRNESYSLVDENGEKFALESIPHSTVDLDAYALHRPRYVTPSDHPYLVRDIDSQEEIFIVMPKNFESRIFSNIERVLSSPLSAFGSALIEVSMSRNGHLDFSLTTVTANDGTVLQPNHSMKGL